MTAVRDGGYAPPSRPVTVVTVVMHRGHDCYGSLAWCITTVKHDLDVGE